ncbi:MAG: molybdopterin-dependent oxidoreductase [Coriobacteriales bacterium]|jgi:molybdopterin-containing oxidoreductase family molybdopterin binding subunit|nr:molybdopterin-dependent oxidoreductase [Coriobacteriales bacterium]
MSQVFETHQGLWRRDFLKLTGIAALSIPVAQTLAACSPASSPADDAAAGVTGGFEYDRMIRTVCAPNCVGSCAINTFVKDDTIIKVEPADFPDTAYNRICLRGISNAIQRVYSPDRVKYPLKRAGERGSGEWERISWEDAIELIYEKMTYNIENYGPTANAWLGMTGNYGVVPQIFATMMAMTYEGTSFTNFGIMGDNGCNMGFLPTLGVEQDASCWEDLVGTKSIIMFGCNYSETNMQEMHFVFDAQETGSKLIVVDPRFSRTASKADWWIPIRPGTDAAMVMGMMNWIVANDRFDAEFIRTYTNSAFLVDTATGAFVRQGEDYVVYDEAAAAAVPVKALPDENKPAYPSVEVNGDVPETCNIPAAAALTGSYDIVVADKAYAAKPAFQLMVESLEAFTPEAASAICEVPAEDIIKLATMYVDETPSALRVSQGTNRYYNGHLPTRALIQLAAICGNIGKEHANISWAGGSLMRILFALPLSAVQPYPEHFSTAVPGSRWIETVATQQPHPIKLLWINNYGWGTQGPDRNRVLEEALPQLDFVIVSEVIMAPGTDFADLVLPITSFYEEDFQLLASWSNDYLQIRDQAIPAMYEAKTDYQVGQLIAERFGILDETEWALDIKEWHRKNIIEGSVAPEFARVDFDELLEKKVVRADFPTNPIAFKSLRFNTPSGKVEVYAEQLVEFGEQLACHYEPIESNKSNKATTYPLTFMNCRTVYTTHSQHVGLPWISEVVAPEPWLEISPVDAEARSVATGDVVEVFNDRGSYKVKALVTPEIKPGCLNQRQGWWPKHFPDNTHYSSLLQNAINPAQDVISETNYSPYDNLVEVRKA